MDHPGGPKQRAILVLGMHRSGTSVLTGLLKALGVDLGPEDALLFPSDDAVNETNRKGFFELRDVVGIHDSLLLDLGMQWDCVGSLPQGWLESRPAVRAEAELMAVLGRRFSRSAVWGVKDPRMCRFMPLWSRLLVKMNTAPTFVVASRDPGSVAASLGRRDGLTPNHALELWYTYMTDVLEEIDGGSGLVVSYDRVVANPQGELDRLNRLLGIAGEDAMDKVRGQVKVLVDPAMRHHAATDRRMLPGHIRELDEALERAGGLPTGGVPHVDAVRTLASHRAPGLRAYVGEVERRCVNAVSGPWCQVFYGDDERRFQEETSERIPLRGSRGAKEFRTVIVCKRHAASVRIDPLNVPGLVWDMAVHMGRRESGGYGRIPDDSFQMGGGVVLQDGRYLFVGRDSQIEIVGLHAEPGDVLMVSFMYDLLAEGEVVSRLETELGAIEADRQGALGRLAETEANLNGRSVRVAELERELEVSEEREAQIRGELALIGRDLVECRAQSAALEDMRIALQAKVEDLARERESEALSRKPKMEIEAHPGGLWGMGPDPRVTGALGRLRTRIRSVSGGARSEERGHIAAGGVNPLISVVVPSYNHEVYVENAVMSVLKQTYPRVELIVVDDGSTDRTCDVVAKALAAGSVERCELIQQENRGAHAAINRGLSLARGDVLAILNSDDMYAESRLEAMWSAMTASQAGFAFSAVRHIDANGCSLDERHPYRFGYDSSWRAREAFPSLGFLLLLYNLSVSTGNFVMARGLAESVGEFQSFRIVHDWDYLLRVLTVCEPLVVPGALLDYRVHGSNTVSVSGGVGREEGVVVIRGYRERADRERFSNGMAPCAANWPGYYRWFVERYRLP